MLPLSIPNQMWGLHWACQSVLILNQWLPTENRNASLIFPLAPHMEILQLWRDPCSTADLAKVWETTSTPGLCADL